MNDFIAPRHEPNRLMRSSALRTHFLIFCLAGLLGPLAMAGCKHSQVSPPPPNISANSSADTALGPGDVFVVDVFGEKDLSGKFRISAVGTIDYPFAGRIQVAGMTPPDVASLLKKKLADGYLKDPSVSVFVESYNSKKISVFGQVQKPGTFNYMNNMSIIEAITLAGGFTPLASKNDISVTRVENGKSRRFTVPVEEIGEGKAMNYLLTPGDIVFIPERMF
jgi:polysaccharide biosynthesis/export protein